ncbi:MAG: hypothetical protein Harvfovirus61_2 [Harvfovirus sp.]|uniref:Uncharacterized protein n=1 Tax=Harvfovirus sp. TaxID=2487768 RepID=A0A3G5A8T2_9VIRU|nr:MAG: hypothetical protein Harvfovirus61_2 [Harvfovirus sp.]
MTRQCSCGNAQRNNNVPYSELMNKNCPSSSCILSGDPPSSPECTECNDNCDRRDAKLKTDGVPLEIRSALLKECRHVCMKGPCSI